MELKFKNAEFLTIGNKQYFAVETDFKDREIVGNFLSNIKDIFYTLTVKEYRQKRSLNANSYAWVLLNEIGNVLKTDKEEVYLEMLKRYGQCGVVKIKDKDVERFKRVWKYNEEIPKLKEDECTYLKFWVGSSNYDTKEMSIFIEGIVDEAKALGINTLTPDEISKLEGIYETQPSEKN